VRVDRRPLLDTSVDADLFVGRTAEVERLMRAVDLGLNAAVTGPPGTGTTSLLRHIAWRLRARSSAPTVIYLSGGDFTAARDVLHRLYQRLAGDEAAAIASMAGLDADALIERVSAALPATARTVVLFDDLRAPVGRSLFGALRDELWRLEVTWVVGVAAAEADALLRPPVDVFFEVVTGLGPLSRDESSELLQRRAPQLSAADRLALTELAEGEPRRLVDLARAVLVDGISVGDLARRRHALDGRIERVSRPAADLVAALSSLGAASPSDGPLQARMGVSRPRLVALFHELRNAGLVREAPPAREGSGPGRPRTRYVLTGGGSAENVGPAGDPSADVH
jgi:hypothetical protein